ncbi:hypothetical protein BT96DRAFT_940202 [Gymnopus androsaceus JB14]|uniref:Uncharacterized protein n=1 Tax=Gymnopus androsaceus JB14 TaxID=1447944 RepID=A0A6A4HLH9_9AGAR|nr:hypothetical protein BT96DRAFT_940202 [Gymnopus androsaceus JB14]
MLTRMQDRGFKCCENILEPKNILDPTWAEVYLALELHTDGSSSANGGKKTEYTACTCNPIVQVRPVSRLHTYGSLDTSWAKEEVERKGLPCAQVAHRRLVEHKW